MSGTLPIWLERMLGVEPAARGEGTVWRLTATWPCAPWVTLLLAAGAIAWVGYLYARESSSAGRAYRAALAVLRLSALALAALMFAEVSLNLERTGLPYVVVVVDDSASMTYADRYDDALRAALLRRMQPLGLTELSRMNLAKMLLLEHDAALLQEIAANYKLKVCFLSESARDQSGSIAQVEDKVKQYQATGQHSRLGQGVRSVINDLRGTPPAAIVVLTDGITTDGETLGDAAAFARRRGVPLFTVALGSDKPVHDLRLSDLVVDEVVFVNDVVNFEFTLTGVGYQGRQVEITLRDAAGDRRALASMKSTVEPDGQPQKLRLPYRPTQKGEYQYVVEAEVLPDEKDAASPYEEQNNHQAHGVTVRDEAIRVLLVQAYPSREFRFLKAMLERDKTIALSTVLQDADPEYAEFDKTALRVFPVRREDLFQFDVILFGDVNPELLTATAIGNISDFVKEKGGGLVFVAGPKYTPLALRDSPLAALMPIDVTNIGPNSSQTFADGFVIQPTELGLASPQMQLGDTPSETAEIWRKLPAVDWLLEAPRWKESARVLAEHPTKLAPDGRKLPVILLQYVGSGKVLFHCTDDTWRWRYQVGDVFFARYWIQTIRYLSHAKLVGKDRAAALTSDRDKYQLGDSAQLRVRFFDERQAPPEDDGVSVVVQQEGDKTQQIKLTRNAVSRGVFEGLVDKPGAGRFHAWIAAPTLAGPAPVADFVVEAPLGESARIETDSADLKRAATDSNGHFYRVETAGDLLGDLPTGRQVTIESLEPRVLWNWWPVLLLFVLLLTAEWLLRKRRGMA